MDIPVTSAYLSGMFSRLVTMLAVLWVAVRVYRAGAVNGASIGDLGKMLKGMFRKRAI